MNKPTLVWISTLFYVENYVTLHCHLNDIDHDYKCMFSELQARHQNRYNDKSKQDATASLVTT